MRVNFRNVFRNRISRSLTKISWNHSLKMIWRNILQACKKKSSRMFFFNDFSSIHWYFICCMVILSDCYWFYFLKSINKMQYFDGISDKPQILKDDAYNWSKSIPFFLIVPASSTDAHALVTNNDVEMLLHCIWIFNFELWKKALCYHIVK